MVARYLDVHPVNPQPRLIGQVVTSLTDGGVIAYPTESGYALGCTMANAAGRERLAGIRALRKGHLYALMCADFTQLGPLVTMPNRYFRAVKAAEPGRFTFVLKGSREVPRRLLDEKRKTVGIRLSSDPVVHAILAGLGEPMLTTSLILPGEDLPLTDGWQVQEQLGHLVDVVIDTGECGHEPTTVIDLTGDEPEILRRGAGDPARFEDE